MQSNEVTPTRDNSPEAIMLRYETANRMAIASHNRTMFDSIRDVYFLLAKVKELETKLGEAKEHGSIVDRLYSE